MFDFDALNPWLGTGRTFGRIFLIWLLAGISLGFLRRLLTAFRDHIVTRTTELRDSRRIGTLTSVFRYTSNVVITAMAAMLTMSELGISVAPVIATAGVAGIAVGFGAQSLVKDFFSGLFLLIENQVSEGDTIEAAGKSGYVERVTLRHIRIRDYDGSVHFIPNGMITTVTNKSRDFAYAIIDLNVPRSEDMETLFAAMRRTSDEMRQDTVLGSLILDDIDIAGVEKIEAASVNVRGRIKVIPAKQWHVRHEFLRRMKITLDEMRAKEG
ncbi:mechanosensitive ion channel family protein [Noviherbaspirillum cavernae]|uniref:Mechanosensitive ion channel family protein n=2 Tax=Noviherbaspirillum cavernae TaxID=2320862 RepID=A0A418X6F9_9BURK|nr:mechanosensitive ion channel family protein [Noviherbaspirillum cavernae]